MPEAGICSIGTEKKRLIRTRDSSLPANGILTAGMKISARHRAEVLRGFRLVANLLLGFATLVLVTVGAATLTGDDPGRFGRGGDFLALLISASILFATANHWKTWIAGFFGVPGVFAAIAILMSGHMPAWPYKPVPWREGALVLTVTVLLTGLTFPSVDFRKPSDSFSRACLTVAVITFFVAVAHEATNFGWLACSLTLFTTVRIRNVILKRRRHRHRHASQGNTDLGLFRGHD